MYDHITRIMMSVHNTASLRRAGVEEDETMGIEELPPDECVADRQTETHGPNGWTMGPRLDAEVMADTLSRPAWQKVLMMGEVK